MGLLDAIYASTSNLKHVSPPVGIYSHMMRDVETTLILQESLLSMSGVSPSCPSHCYPSSWSLFTSDKRLRIFCSIH